MIIEPFHRDDIGRFLELAASEGWVAEPWEFDFLLSAFPAGCLCVRDESGKAAGFVTSLLHERSGWVGNLIVNAEYRGRGLGEALFLRAVHALREADVENIWLTASKTGKSIYEKYGFAAIDAIVRWTGVGKQQTAVSEPEADGAATTATLSGIDYKAWGDRRDALLAATVGRGKLLSKESGFLVIQPCGDSVQFGPFSARDSNTAEHLFDAALRMVASGTKVYMDSPVSNRSALRMFNRRRMQIAGTTELMYAGKRPDYRSEYLFGLATMGSCG